MIKLLSITRSSRKGKKYTAKFRTIDSNGNNRVKNVHFGAEGYEDYTIHHDKSRRANYWRRHINDNFARADSPGALSAIILWGPSTDIIKNIKLYEQLYGV